MARVRSLLAGASHSNNSNYSHYFGSFARRRAHQLPRSELFVHMHHACVSSLPFVLIDVATAKLSARLFLSFYPEYSHSVVQPHQTHGRIVAHVLSLRVYVTSNSRLRQHCRPCLIDRTLQRLHPWTLTSSRSNTVLASATTSLRSPPRRYIRTNSQGNLA